MGRRPIPAGAGKPAICRSSRRTGRADPRGRGETVGNRRRRRRGRGRSPRARGNPQIRRRLEAIVRPIPAGAGKPRCRSRRRGPRTADPRGRGETSSFSSSTPRIGGRSPRARGNPSRGRPRVLGVGPIPAGAGKPSPSRRRCSPPGADPRGRGETDIYRRPAAAELGRSPRARGNRRVRYQGSLRPRPIPAGAGKPRVASAALARRWADPRGRGETKIKGHLVTDHDGRSPRARGNPPGAPCTPGAMGPIPAGAGKPSFQGVLLSRIRADPRGRGETLYTATDE